MSVVSQSKPARAMKRAAVMLPSDSQVPTAGWPALSKRLTGLGRMRFLQMTLPSSRARKERALCARPAA